MNRREFLTRAVPATTLPFVLQGFSLQAYGQSPLLSALTSAAYQTDRVLVLIQLNGGNDGLNTVIALDRYAELTAARPNILIPSNRVLLLTSTTGLHPSMTGLQTLYNAGQLAVIQAVGYPNPNFSHFRATDIWLTATDAKVVASTGWLGRYLEEEFTGYPTGYPNAVMPDPLALQIGSVISPALQGDSGSMGLAVSNPNSTYTYPGADDTPPNTPAGHELTFIRQVAQQTQQYSTVIRAASARGTNLSTLYPTAGQNSLADQLKIVARLIAGGLMTTIYIVNIGGFDTHSAQATASDTTLGTHATLLGRLSTAILAFQDDLTRLGLAQRVVGMTFSEFGRRIKSNSSGGTDHGTAAPMFIFGTNVNASVFGTSPVLPATPTVSDNVPLQFDFRSVYASVLKDWFGASQTEIDIAVTGTISNPLTSSVIASGAVASASGQQLPRDFTLEQNYPNPFNPTTVIRYSLPHGSNVLLEVYTTTGQRVAVLVDALQEGGIHEVTFDGRALASGAYFYRLRAGDFQETRKMLFVR
ncbi:MAG: DUF1501 domain-containing protein [Bacteroidota bacterium]